MKATFRKILGFTLAMLLPFTVQAQDDYEAMQQSQEHIDQMFLNVGELVEDVRFNEEDVTSLISLWVEFNEVGEMYDDDDAEEETIADFKAIMEDANYRRWAASHDLDADDWMRKMVRITMTLYREQMLEAGEAMPAQMEEQLRMIEEQRHQLGEELYQQMKQGLESYSQYGSSIMDSAKHLPVPTAAEQALLDQYRDELMMVMESGDDDYDEYDDYGDYE